MRPVAVRPAEVSRSGQSRDPKRIGVPLTSIVSPSRTRVTDPDTRSRLLISTMGPVSSGNRSAAMKRKNPAAPSATRIERMGWRRRLLLNADPDGLVVLASFSGEGLDRGFALFQRSEFGRHSAATWYEH